MSDEVKDPGVPAPPTPEIIPGGGVAPEFTATNQNVIVENGGGHRTHYSVWKNKTGVEYIYIDGIHPRKLSEQTFRILKRETVTR